MNTNKETKETNELVEVLKEKEIQELIKNTHNGIWNSNEQCTRGTIKHINKYRISTIQRFAINIIDEYPLKTKLTNSIYYRKYTKVTQESLAVLSICFNDVKLTFHNNINDSNEPRDVACIGMNDIFLYNFDTDSLGTPEELLFEIQLMQNFNSSTSPEDILVLLEIYSEVQNIINPKE